jgi:hypothetical protein
MRAWIKDVDEDHVAFVHATSGTDLDTLATYCKEAGDVKQASDWKHAASVDGTVIMAWCNKLGIEWNEFFNDQKLVNQFLNDPENGVFRIWKGRV